MDKKLLREGVPRKMIFYKYTGSRSEIETLRQLSLKVNPPNKFNDPFEFTPQTVNPMKHAKRAYAVFRKMGSPCSFDHFQQKIWPVIRQNRNWIEKFVRETVHDDFNEIDRASEIVGVLCLSKWPDDIRMWSHYAQDHRGIAIGLNVGASCFRRATMFSEVKYSSQRPKWDLLLTPNTKEWFNQVANVALTKSAHWKDEQEHRMIFRLRDLKKERIQKKCPESRSRPQNKNEDFNFFVPIHADAVQEVFMGCCISEGDKWEIKNILAENFPRARLYRMNRHDTKFELARVPV